MARPRKKFSENEFRQALSYIDRKLKLDDNWPGKDAATNERAKREFERARLANDLDGLEAWCDRWLDEAGRSRLLAALRARKKRARPTGAKKTLSLDPKAWLYLSELAKHNRVTISEYLLRKLERDYMNLPVRRGKIEEDGS